MEARNFVTAREMVNQNNWILTTMNDLPRYEKPPLPTWLTAISGAIFCFDSLTAMRLPSALTAILLLFTFYRFLPKFQLSKHQAFISSLVLATSFYIVFSGRDGQWDIYTHTYMLVAIYFLWKIFNGSKNLYKYAVPGAIFFGFSLLSKGPVSFYALLLPFLISYGIVYKYPDFKIKLKALLIFLLLGIIVGGWWFAYVRWIDPEPFIEITAQETSRWGNYNVRPFYYYWSFFVQSGIWTIPSFVALLYPYLKNKVSNPRAYKFSFLWTIIAVVLLSVIPEKKSRYLLPVLIPMAMNTGFYIEYLFRNFKSLPKSENWIIYFNHGLIGSIGLAFPLAAFLYLDLDGFWLWYFAASVALFGIGLGIYYFLWKKKYPPVFYLTVSFIVAVIIFAFPLTYTFLDNPYFNNIKSLKNFAENKDLKIYEYDSFTPELIWEYGQPIPIINNPEEVNNEKEFGLLFLEKDSTEIKSQFSDYQIKNRKRFDLNYVNPEASGYKERLIRKFYLFSKTE
ncbi:ArnT family glycosyltransferase [Salegentibacter sp.]|uniref:ArnT family glycosyltransferase n=1 Tax=Salegentibacter sp. TaxID=1903072 RepID=UPI0035618507